mmetsp:Transcript_17461/g.55884  ORF Transcript_17461/g.55884 Transcript_17461/m.55884 type:complete len:369 (-) Transcript_17461:76-1182(-)
MASTGGECSAAAAAAAARAAAPPPPGAAAAGPGRPEDKAAGRTAAAAQQPAAAAEEEAEPLDPEAAAEGREVDELVQQRLQDLDFTDTPDLKTPWLPCGSDPGVAEARLFCFFGAGKQAAQYRQWNERAIQSCPSIAVCPVELPGKGMFKGDTMGNAHEVAEAFIREVLDPISKDGRPWALFGFSIGARICYEIARRRPPVRLYVSGRAAPHVGARKAGEVGATDAIKDDVTAYLQWVAARGWGNEAIIARVLEHAKDEKDPEGYLRKFAKPIMDDISIGETELRDTDSSGSGLPLRPSCRIYVYDSQKDTTWPSTVVKNTWDRYAPGGKCRKRTYPSLSHEELCSISGDPLLKEILVNLHEILFSGQ